MGVFSGLCKPNARVRVERLVTSRDAHGGTAESYAAVPGAESVPCLVGQQAGARPGNFAGRRNWLSGSLLGDHPALGLDGTRLYFLGVTGGPVQEMTGRYAVVDSVTPHGPGVALIPYRWYSIQWTEVGTGTGDGAGGEGS